MVDIAADLYDMINQDEIIAMCHFIDCFFVAFWLPHFCMLQRIDIVSKKSGHMARHMAAFCCIMCSSISKLQTAMHADPGFEKFFNRKNAHVNDPISTRLIFENLPKLVLDECMAVFNKHFRQWLSSDSLWCLIAGEKAIATTFSRYLFNLPIDLSPIELKFAKRTIDPLRFTSFAFNDVDLPAMKQNEIFRKCDAGFLKVANGTCLFDNNSNTDSDFLPLQMHAKSMIVPIPANTQYVESKIKDVSLCHTNGRSETTIACVRNIRSQLIQQISAATKADLACQDR